MRAVLADVLDLRHRLPLVWACVEALEAEVWVARRVAVLCRALGQAAAAIVDAAVADAISGESPGRVLDIAAAKVIEADTAAHRARLEAQARRRFVALSRTDAHGLRHVIARVAAGDAVWVDAMVDRVADILLTRPGLRPGTPDQIGRDEARSIAFGWLARPADLLALLTGADLDRADLARARPRVTLYVHLHQSAVDGTAAGVARVEGLGPLLLDQVRDLLGHAHVSLRPVIDLHDRTSVNAYEHPEAVKERTHLRQPGDAFPHASRTTRSVDLDHPVAYRASGPPGQTGDHNVQPLSRTAHRAKTHLGYQVTQTVHDDRIWRTPHGLHRLVDERGTHRLDADLAADLTSDDPLDRALARLLHRLRTGALG